MTSFKVKARVLLELGAELISSDAIALYELIKNAIDAGSPKVELRVVSVLTASGYRVLSEDLKRLLGRRVPRAFLEKNLERYVDPESSKRAREKLLDELDDVPIASASEKLRQAYLATSYIEIEDWGHGMSVRDLDEKFLTIGTPHRALEREEKPRDGKILGEKGIGRLSAMRLGEALYVRTSRSNMARWAELKVDWAILGEKENIDLDLSKFEVSAEDGDRKDNARAQGTLVRISGLKNDWFRHRIVNIAETEFSKLQNPFDRKAAKLDLRLKYNGDPLDEAIKEIDTDWLKKGWHGYFKINFGYVDDEDGVQQPSLTGEARFRVPGKDGNPDPETQEVDSAEIAPNTEKLYSVLADPDLPIMKGGTETNPARYAGIGTLGAFSAEGYWYNRQRKKLELEKDNYNDEFKPWLEQWGGGLLMYRDGFRVYPYAEPDDDWLELDQKALRRKSFKLNRGQFVGHVRITSAENKYLRDQTNRQGLVDSPEKKRLVQCLQYAIWDGLGTLVKKHELKSAQRALGSISELDREVKRRTKEAHGSLNQLAKRAPQEVKLVKELRDYVDELQFAWSKAKSTIKQQQVQADVYLHLAGVGILLEFVVHELARVTKATLTDLNALSSSQLSPGFKSLGQQLKTLEKRLRILDPVSTPGRQRKEPVSVTEVIATLVDAHVEQFERHEIELDWNESNRKKRLESKVVIGHIFQIFENLISNSVYWLGHHRTVLKEARRKSEKFTPKISIEVDAAARTVAFSDNGTGIEPNEVKKIFEAFYSNKPAGRGIGLYIVRKLCDENNMQIRMMDKDERDVHPGFVLTFP